MKPIRKISRRSFLSRVGGFSALALTGCATPREEATPYDPLENAQPRERGRVLPGSEARGCSDGDSGRRSDPTGRGRRCRTGRH
ncbi:MAG TPA: hypothetical protein VGO55_18515 [Allosphingosinicella sp.]|jgi:hypothetical protein|nr:hypothetical protein [Allosphingosinicella sp.]